MIISILISLELPLKTLERKYTGRILIDMSEDDKCLIQVEYENQKNQKTKRVVEEYKDFPNVKQPHEVKFL